MGWWFGRKSAPADARPFMPPWLSNGLAEEGFARCVEGLRVYVKSSGVFATHQSGACEIGSGAARACLWAEQVAGDRAAAIGSPAGGSSIDVEARSGVNAIPSALHQHGPIEA
jgi:hypothetical protein